MTNASAPAIRVGQSHVPQGGERTHVLIALVEDKPGSLDRVVGVLRRRRALLQSLTVAQTETEGLVRVTALVKDSEVDAAHLLEQLRKIVDIRQVQDVTDQQVVARELALIKVSLAQASANDIVGIGQQFGANALESTADAVTLEVVGSQEHIEKLLQALQPYGIQEVARSGGVAIASLSAGK